MYRNLINCIISKGVANEASGWSLDALSCGDAAPAKGGSEPNVSAFCNAANARYYGRRKNLQQLLEF